MSAFQRIKSIVEHDPVVLFMKGSPRHPMCESSARAVDVLTRTRLGFTHVNVLEEPEIRTDLPRYSHWPTFPQLFVGGEFIGGCEVAVDLYDSGELRRLLADAHRDRQ